MNTLDFSLKNDSLGSDMNKKEQLEARVAARRERLHSSLQESERLATAKVSRGNVYLLMGRYATGMDLKKRLHELALALRGFA